MLKHFCLKNMETLGYIHTAMAHEEKADSETQPVTALRNISWWQMSGASALMAVIVLGSCTRVATMLTSPTTNPVQQQATNS